MKKLKASATLVKSKKKGKKAKFDIIKRVAAPKGAKRKLAQKPPWRD